jgi:hypothetical protein
MSPVTHESMFLPEDGVDLQMRVPQRSLEFVGRGMLVVGEDKSLAGGAVPVRHQ